MSEERTGQIPEKDSSSESGLKLPALPAALEADWTVWSDELGDRAKHYVESFGEDGLREVVAPLALALVARLSGLFLRRHGYTPQDDDPIAAGLKLALTGGIEKDGRPIVDGDFREALEGYLDERASVDAISWGYRFSLGSPVGRQVAARVLDCVTDGEVVADWATPKPLAALMVGLLDPRALDTIYDPCFGTGELLTAVARCLRVDRRRPDYAPAVFGAERNIHAHVVGLAGIALSGCSPVVSHYLDELHFDRHGPGTQGAPGFWWIDHGLAGALQALDRESLLDIDDLHEEARSVPIGLGNDAQCWMEASRVSGSLGDLGPYSDFNGFDGVVADLTRGSLARSESNRVLEHVVKTLRPGGRAVVALLDPGRDRQRDKVLAQCRVEGAIASPAQTLGLRFGSTVNVLVLRREDQRPYVHLVSLPQSKTASPDRIAAQYRRAVDRQTHDGGSNAKPTRGDWQVLPHAVRESMAADLLSRSVQQLNVGGSRVLVRPLGEVAELLDGKQYATGVTNSRQSPPKQSVGIIRVGDVRSTGLRSPSRFLGGGDAASLDSQATIRAGDVLLTTSGSVGRVAVVPETAPSAVAGAGIAIVRPTDGVRSQFLHRILASDAYRNWLLGHARGATIPRVPPAQLRQLPIPLPPMELQERVERLVSATRGAGFAAIARVLTNTGDAVMGWLEESAEIGDLQAMDDNDDGSDLLERIADSLWQLHDQVDGFQVATLPELARWLEEVSNPVAALQGLTDVPVGPERLAVLDRLILELERITASRRPSSPATALAYDVTGRISRLATQERERILADVAVRADVVPTCVAADAGGKVQVQLTNCSPLALRGFDAVTHPNLDRAQTPYLAAGATLNVPVRVPPHANTGTYGFTVRWRAARLDGTHTTDRISVAVDVRESAPPSFFRDIGSSPYIVGSPIDRKEMLFGRGPTIDEIRRQLRVDSRANVILLEGNRRTGKTSILKRLQDPDVLPDWIAVNCSLQAGEGHASKAGLPTNEVFRLLARDLGWAAHAAGVPVWLPEADPPRPGKPFKVAFARALRSAFSGDRPFETFELFLQTVMEAARPRRVLLMVDEFDKLQEGIDNGVTSPQVPENIRYLLHTYPELSAVLAGSRRIKRLREEYWNALFGFGHRVPVGGLELEDARLLVTRPVDGRLVYVPEARDLVVEMCAGAPFLIQTLCNRIFESAANSSRRTVTVDDVNAAAEAMTEDNEHFRTLWGYAGTERRRFLLALCQRLGNRAPITLDRLETSLTRHGVHLHRGERLGDDLEHLLELEMIGIRSASAYRLAIPLMAAWIERNVDFEHQRRRAVEEFEEADHGDAYWRTREEEDQ